MLDKKELNAVKQVFDSQWLGRGEKARQFEQDFATHLGVNPENLLSVTSCTEGLFASIQALGIGPGDEVIIPSIHFVGAANAVMAAGAKPVFCDVLPTRLNARTDDIEQCITGKTKAIVTLHYGGMPSAMLPVGALARSEGIHLIEDSACSPYTMDKEEHKYFGTFGDIGLWSFDAMKIITTGDGGMVYCKDKALRDKIENMLYLGMNTQSGLSSDKDRWWEFEVSYPGRRGLMNDLNAAIGIEQLKKLPSFVARRKEIWDTYQTELAGLDWLTLPPEPPSYVQSSYYFYWVQCDRRDELAGYLRANGVYTTFRYYPLHRVFKTGQVLPGADYAADHTLLLPLHQGLSDSEVSKVIELVRGFDGDGAAFSSYLPGGSGDD